KQMRVKDGGVFGTDRFRDLLLHLEDLHPSLHERRFKPRNFISNLRRLDVVARHVVEIVADDMNDGARESGRDACSAKSDFLVIAAHPRAILKRNQSS